MNEFLRKVFIENERFQEKVFIENERFLHKNLLIVIFIFIFA